MTGASEEGRSRAVKGRVELKIVQHHMFQPTCTRSVFLVSYRTLSPTECGRAAKSYTQYGFQAIISGCIRPCACSRTPVYLCNPTPRTPMRRSNSRATITPVPAATVLAVVTCHRGRKGGRGGGTSLTISWEESRSRRVAVWAGGRRLTGNLNTHAFYASTASPSNG